MNTVKIYNAGDTFEVDRVVELLKDNNIECYIMESGIGGYLAIQQSFSIYGKDIYVAEENEDKAKGLINKFKEENCDNNDIDYDESAVMNEDKDDIIEENENEYKVPWFKNRVIVARILLAFLVIAGIVSFFLR